MQASDIMTTKLVTATPDTQIDEIANLMMEHNVSGVPIVDDGGAVVGIVSEGDLLRRVEGAADRPRGLVRRPAGNGTTPPMTEGEARKNNSDNGSPGVERHAEIGRDHAACDDLDGKAGGGGEHRQRQIEPS